jgi:hypothetical protein
MSKNEDRMAKQSSRGVFTAKEYLDDPRRVVVHAVNNGEALVVGDDGRPQIAFDIPTTELPALD